MDISIVPLVMMSLMTCMTVAGIYQTVPVVVMHRQSDDRG